MFLTSRYHKFILSSLMIVLSFLIMAQAGLAAWDENTTGLKTTGDGAKISTTGDLSVTIGKVVGAALSFLGVVFFVLIIYGGYTWMFSLGNEQTAAKAKNIIIAAVIGMVIVLMAYVITSYMGKTLGPTPPTTPAPATPAAPATP